MQGNKTDDKTVSRFGGDEFLVLLPHTRIDRAIEIGNRIKKEIENTEFFFTKLTVSIGVTESKTNEILIDVIQRTDKALYRAKKSGKSLVFYELKAI